MYAPDPAPLGDAPRTASVRAASLPRVVWWIGLSSLLADVSAESVASALPVFLLAVLQLSPLEVGVLDGVYQGGAALVRVAAGAVADRRHANHRVALLGYGLSVLSRVGFLLAGAAGLLLALASLCMDRIGKGIRTAPRDALIAGHVPRAQLGAAFGLHRAMDAGGALAGPLLGAALLAWPAGGGYIGLFAASALAGAAGWLVFRARVPEAPRLDAEGQALPLPLQQPLPLRHLVARLVADRPFVALCALSLLLSAFTVSDGLLYLTLQQGVGLDGKFVPLMFAGTAAVFLATASPLGRMADRHGPVPLFVAGYAGLAALYALLALWQRPPAAVGWGVVAALGLHYAATDGVLAAAAARTLDPRVRTTGLATLATAVGLTRLGASALYGALWQAGGPGLARGVFATGLAACCAVGIGVLAWRRGRAA